MWKSLRGGEAPSGGGGDFLLAMAAGGQGQHMLCLPKGLVQLVVNPQGGGQQKEPGSKKLDDSTTLRTMVKSRVSECPRLREEGENHWCDAVTDQVTVLERLADGQKGTEGKSHKRDIDRLSAMCFAQVSSMFAYMFDESDKMHHGETSEVDAAALLEFARQHKKHLTGVPMKEHARMTILFQCCTTVHPNSKRHSEM